MASSEDRAAEGSKDNSPNVPALPSTNTNSTDKTDHDADKATAASTASSMDVTNVHEHRLSHNPSKLPGLRFVDRGQLQAGRSQPQAQNQGQNNPRSLPQGPQPAQPAAVSSGAGSTTRATNSDSGNLSTSTSTSSSAAAPTATSCHQPNPPPTPSTPTSAPDQHDPINVPISPLTPSRATLAALASGPSSSRSTADSLHHACTDAGSTSADTDRRLLPLHSTASPNLKSPPSQTASPAAPVITGKSAYPSSPFTPRSEVGTDSSRYCTPATRPPARRNSSLDYSPLSGRPKPRRNVSWDSNGPQSLSASHPYNDRAHGQRESTLPKTANLTFSDEHNKALARRFSSASRPPVSQRPIPPGSAPGRIPPIREFHLSGYRKSYPPDMNHSPSRYYDDGDEYQESNSRDRSLRALEGRYSNDRSRNTGHPNMDHDDDVAESENNTADIFMSIAREDSSNFSPRRNTDQDSDEDQSAGSRAVRTARNARSRPQSTYSSTAQKPQSPPPVSRRLSDQQPPTSRATRRAPDNQIEQQSNRSAVYQSSSIGRPSLKLDSSRGSPRVPALKPSPITPRTQSVLENSADRNSIFARRPSTRNGDGHARSSSIKQPSGLSKSFNASTSVPKNGPPQQTPNGQYVEASESSNSTAAPSTVWDELDELKSRIHRLELTGKLPMTSSAAMSRTPEERPPTAGTGATTLSGSPKRAQTEVMSLASSQRETQTNLRSILSKTKPFVSSDVYDAIEAAANDALSLSQLMGTAGQSGPISSGASTIGVGGPSTVTDRQLRKKADSICRSLTELCIALKEEEPERLNTSHSRPQTRGTSRSGRDDGPRPRSPAMKIFNGTGPDEPFTSIESYDNPHVTRFDKRATFNFTGMGGMINEASPRYGSSVIGGGDDDTMTGRKSSLVLARARRGVTEEPDDKGRKTTLLRTRRTASEEPEEQESGRRSSVVFAPRRVTTIGRVSNIDEEPQMQSRAPSRALTEVSNARTEVGNALRINVPTRDSIARRPMGQEPASASAALSRTRLLTSGLPTPGPFASRMMTPSTPGGRRFLHVNRQQVQEDNNTSNITGRLVEERGQRYSIAGPSATGVSRGPTLHRKRHSGIPSISGTVSNVGGYR